MNERFEDDDLRAAYAPRLSERAAHGLGCPSPDALLAAVRGEGPEAERLQVLDHALRCAACRPELALLQSVSGAGERSRGVVALSWFRRRLAPLAIAASLLVVAGMFGVDQWRKRTGDEITRSPGGEGEPALIAPGNQAETAATLTFVWHPVAGALRYTLELTGTGGRVFADLTSANVGRRLAIVLDGNLYSAPVIRERIPSGQAQITGGFNSEEATDLAIVLRAGALPAPVQILEERTVGPSLGADSIRKGIMSTALAAMAVVLFMLLYYRLSGLVADVALALNLLILLAAMAGFHATLTLPGIAGVVLTIGMAVDTNILIFERIREELRSGKTVRAAIESGFARAFRTVIDTHVTVLVSAAILYQFGTGPVKGFAVTLAIGIFASLFTAVFFTRLVFDLTYMRGRRVESISI